MFHLSNHWIQYDNAIITIHGHIFRILVHSWIRSEDGFGTSYSEDGLVQGYVPDTGLKICPTSRRRFWHFPLIGCFNSGFTPELALKNILSEVLTLGSMVIFDENQGVSDLSKYEFLCPIHVKIIKFLVIWHHFDCFYLKKWSENPSKSTENSPKTR